jgi:hypothetical protein
MKTVTAIVVLAAALLAPAVASARDDRVRTAIGTVATIEGPHVGLKTTDGRSLMVMLDKETTVTRGKETLDASAVKVGDRVSVDYIEEKGMNMARAVKLAAVRK